MKKFNFSKFVKVLVFSSMVAVLVGAYFFGNDYFSLAGIKDRLADLQAGTERQPFLTFFTFFAVYVLVVAASFPGAAILTLLAGALFGLFWGTLLASFASTIGATLAFLSSRYLFRDYVLKKFNDRLGVLNNGLENQGIWYLVSLRLVPAVPFFMVNLMMGLTAVSVWRFYFYSQISMILGTIVYVNAGLQLSRIESLSGILSPSLVLAFTLLGLLPFFLKPLAAFLSRRRLYSRFKKPKTFDYNLVVIGAGSGGLVSAYIAAALKSKVALIEKHRMGGDCLNTGCVPSKALIRSARFLAEAEQSRKIGISETKVDFDFQDVMNRVNQVIEKIEPHDSIERYESLGVECISGDAFIISPYEVQVNNQTLSTKNIVIATGAAPRVPSIPGVDEIPAVTTEELWKLRELPKKLLILGGGPVGCEMAQSFAAFGSEVMILESGSHLLGKEEPEVSDLIEAKFKEENILIETSAKIQSFVKNGDENLVHFNANGVRKTLSFSICLLAVGRKPRIEGFGLEALGVEITNDGFIKVDPYLRSNFPNIYACGDVAGPYQLTHAASFQAWFVAVNALFSPLKKFRINYDSLPWVTYTSPEVARVGLSEEEARQKNIPYETTKYDIQDLDRAITDSVETGFIKVITKKNSDKILGVTIVASHAGEMIAEFVLAMKNKLGLNKILSATHAYPTMAEGNKYVAGVWKRRHAPQKTLSWLEALHKWRRR